MSLAKSIGSEVTATITLEADGEILVQRLLKKEKNKW
jgi:hypothetical protein